MKQTWSGGFLVGLLLEDIGTEKAQVHETGAFFQSTSFLRKTRNVDAKMIGNEILDIQRRPALEIARSAHGNYFERLSVVSVLIVKRWLSAINAAELTRLWYFSKPYFFGDCARSFFPGTRNKGRANKGAIAGASSPRMIWNFAVANHAISGIRACIIRSFALPANVDGSHMKRSALAALAPNLRWHLCGLFLCSAKHRPTHSIIQIFALDTRSALNLRAAISRNPAGFLPFMDGLRGDARRVKLRDTIQAYLFYCLLNSVHAVIQLQVEFNVKFIWLFRFSLR